MFYNRCSPWRPKTRFKKTNTKLYVPVVTLSTRDNAKLLEQSKSGFKRPINWNKYLLEVTVEQQTHHLDFLINPNFQGVNFFYLFYCFKIMLV